MNDLQKKILELLKEVEIISKKYDIPYYAVGGTAIGAIRHRGFIPWDDDADIYMTRDNFLKFREAFKKENPQGRVLGSLEDNPDYPGTIPRYIDDNTSLVAKYHILDTTSAGVVLDIFLIDPIPNDENLIDEYMGKLNIYADMVMPYYGYTNRAKDKWLDEFSRYQEKVKSEGKAAVIKELEKDLFSYKEDECDCYALRWGTEWKVYPKEMFGTPYYVDYEDTQIPLPEKWHDYLILTFGAKWMYIPSHIEDEGHDFIVDLEHKYTNYLIDAHRFIDKEEATNIYEERKKLFVEKEKLIRPFQNEVLRANGKYILLSQEKYLKDSGIDIDDLNKNKDYAAIVKAYKGYLDMQVSQNFIGRRHHSQYYRMNNPVFIPLPDHNLEILIKALYMTGDFNKAQSLIDLRKGLKPLTEAMIWVDNRLKLIYSLMEAYYDVENRKEEALAKLELFSKEEIDTISELSKINLLANIESGNLSQEILDKIETNISKYPQDLEFQKILGDWYYADGKEEAKEIYEKIASHLTNGVMLLDIKDKFAHIDINYDTPVDITKRTILQDKQFELLGEIDEICGNNNIDYILSGETLLFGHYKHILKDQYKTNTIIMTPDNATKFIEVMENGSPYKNRSIEYMLNSSEHDAFSIYYRDTNTLSMDWRKANEGRNVGIHITIFILRKKFLDKGKEGKLAKLEETLESYKANQKDSSNKLSFGDKLKIKSKGPDGLREEIFKGYMDGSKENIEGDYYFTTKKGIDKTYKKGYFEGSSDVTVYDKTFKGPKDIDKYIKDIHGKYAEESVKVRKGNPSIFVVADVNLNYDDIRPLLENNLFSKNSLGDYKKAIALNKKIKPLNDTVKKYWNILLRGEDRFKLYLKYYDLKEEILKLGTEKDYKTLEEVLYDYDKAARKHLKAGLGLCFDVDIYNVYCDLLRHNGEEKLVSKLIDTVPEEHKEEINVLY